MNLADKIRINTHTLANGLRIALIPTKNSEIVSMNLAYMVGSKNELIGRTGLAHLFEHLMFEGSKNIPKGEFDKLCSLAGGVNNAYTSYDVTAYTMTFPSNQIETALWLESDRMLEFSVSQQALETQQKVVTEEIRQTVYDRPYGMWRKLLAENAYLPECAYSWEVHGSIDDVNNADLSYLRTFFNMYYRPGNAILTLCGNIDEEMTLKMIDRYFGEIENLTTEKNFLKFGPELLQKGTSAKFNDKVALPAVFINFHLPGFNDEDIYKADILSNIASSGRSSRLYAELIENQQIASSVGSFVDKRENSSLLTFYAIAADGDVHLEDLKSQLLKEIFKFNSSLVNSNDLLKNINQLTTALANEIQYSSGIADLVATNLLFMNDKDRIYSILEKYKSISENDIQDFAKRHLINGEEIIIECFPEDNTST